ncbi:phage tail protein [Motilibacter deserti]|uniref:Phage tail protein n=1 Tax=Motilibacter deserti TaxID=2714956 RepID=A0ABX0GVS4_9ACTN|nr:phage tail protein [Motilibacter deserti]NHC13801.1 phage tail protein [Motilibacter deserti]
MRGALELEQLVHARPDEDGEACTVPVSPRSIAAQLPGLYQDDDFAQRFVSGLDPVLAPVFVVLDCLEAYFDPDLAPTDFLAWIAEWVGVDPERIPDPAGQRALIRETAALLSQQGMPAALERQLALHTGTDVQLVEGTAPYELVVRLGRLDGSVDRSELEHMVSRLKPAHLLHRLEIATG